MEWQRSTSACYYTPAQPILSLGWGNMSDTPEQVHNKTAELAGRIHRFQKDLQGVPLALEDLHRIGVAAAEASAIQRDAQTRLAQLKQDGKPTDPDPTIQDHYKRMEAHYEQTRDLYLEARRNAGLTQATAEQLQIERDAFIKARDFHRQQAWVLLALVGAIGVAAIWIIVRYFLGEQKIQSEWLAIAGRTALLVGLGWLLKFMGGLHSRHAQQAVVYQDRLGGLDAFEILLKYGDAQTKAKAQGALIESYLGMADNAFALPVRPEDPKVDLEALEKMSRILSASK